ncbi:MAG TPA: flagellar biosynthetic protein FliO [Gammaproteobacteria bacterium]|nr:flagellar biosynthetic protein FliO [Gammaproteobacteria bacterium]
MTPGVDIADLSSVIMSLGLVLTFILGAAFVLRRTPFGGAGRRNGLLHVVATLPLGPKERLLLVQARDAEILIAVSPAGVFHIGAGHLGNLGTVSAGAQPTPTQPATPTFALGENP